MAPFRRWRFQRLVRPHWTAFERFARRLAGSPQDGDDLLQEAVVAAMQRIGGLKDDRAFRTWMFKTLRTVHLDRCDREARHRRRVDAFGTFGEAVVLPFPKSPADTLEAREIGHAVAQAMEALPEDQRLAVWLVDVQGLSFTEAAEVLDLRRGTVCSRVIRGRLALRGDLGEVAAEQGFGQDASAEEP
ncbi:MAG: RNA polymerase sigma factor [Myxococcota bacterium]